MKMDLFEDVHTNNINIPVERADSKDLDIFVENLFRENEHAKKYNSEDIQILSQNVSRVKRTIQELAKSKFPHPVTLNDLMEAFNERFKTKFLKASSITYALKVLRVDWHHEVNKKFGLYNHDFHLYADSVKHELHKKQCLAMAQIREGKSFSEIAALLNVKPSLIKRWFVNFVSSQKL